MTIARAVIYCAFPLLLCCAIADATIQCYKCEFATPTIWTNETIHLCKNFDYSDKFIVNCPYSTFCMKRTFSAKIPGLINGTERDCAPQKMENQHYKNGAWREEISIEEPYQEGCLKPNNRQGLISSTINHCYCRGSLCNAAPKHYSAYSILLALVNVLLVVVLPTIL